MLRTALRTMRLGAGALALGALVALAACQPPSQTAPEPTAPPTNAEREADIAAEQLAALGGPASAETRALYEGEFQASGALGEVSAGEGAWELRLLQDYAMFTRPGLGQDGGVPGEREYHENGMRVVAGPLTITVRAQQCALPNGIALPYSAHVLFEGVAYQGCARSGISSEGAPTWASVLPELLPAIDACLTRVSSRPARVTMASQLGEGVVTVRIRESDGLRRECVFDGAAVTNYDSISDIDRQAGEGDPEFQRGGSAPRAANCRAVEAVGELGWLIKRTC